MKQIKINSLARIIGVTVFAGLAIGLLSPVFFRPHHPSILRGEATRLFSLGELSRYDGRDRNQPIYLAFDGYVYDITAGKSFYQPGGPYHYLAGKDATSQLRLAGGGIVRKKYPIVGKIK